jgi:hypothetical protein
VLSKDAVVAVALIVVGATAIIVVEGETVCGGAGEVCILRSWPDPVAGTVGLFECA